MIELEQNVLAVLAARRGRSLISVAIATRYDVA
jgi:hypothetical protein